MVVIPRAVDRLGRVCHAFGPVPPTVFALASGSTTLGSFEGDFDPSGGAAGDAQRFVQSIGEVLDTARVPHAFVGGDLALEALTRAEWTIVACSGGLDPDFTARAAQALSTSRAVSFGPKSPEFDESMRRSTVRLPSIERPVAPLLLPSDVTSLTPLVEEALRSLGVSRLPAEPAGIHTTLHEDSGGRPRVLFVINSTSQEVEALAHAPGCRRATDALTGEQVLVTGEHAVLAVAAQTVRMLELETR